MAEGQGRAGGHSMQNQSPPRAESKNGTRSAPFSHAQGPEAGIGSRLALVEGVGLGSQAEKPRRQGKPRGGCGSLPGALGKG